MTLAFREFVPKYHDGSIMQDASWRAYDIERMATERKAKNALKALGYSELNQFGFEQAARDFNLAHATQARQLLSLWWTWARIALGEITRGKLRKGQQV